MGGVAFQVFAICLLLMQALVAPLLIGLESFGAQIVLLVPVYLAQAIVEPAFQAHFNDEKEMQRNRFNSIVLLALACIGFLSFGISVKILDQSAQPLILFILASFFINTVFQANAFARGAVRLASLCALCHLLGYVAGLVFGLIVDPSMSLLLANAVGFGLSSTAYFISTFGVESPTFQMKMPSIPKMINGLTFRLPTLTVSNLFILFLSSIGTSPTEIGTFRIFVSALNAGRYANLVSLQQLQVALQRWLTFNVRTLGPPDRIIIIFFLCFVLYLTFIAAAFPWVFGQLFGDVPFDRFAILLSGTFVLLQPLAYCVVVVRSGREKNAPTPFLVVMMIALVSFSSFTWMGATPFDALGYSIILMIVSLLITLLLSLKVVE